MSTKDLKFLVEKLELLVDSRELMESPEAYIYKKDEILEAIIKEADSMRIQNITFPDRHKENFKERQDLVKSNTDAADKVDK
jgi:protein-arginine kinase